MIFLFIKFIHVFAKYTRLFIFIDWTYTPLVCCNNWPNLDWIDVKGLDDCRLNRLLIDDAFNQTIIEWSGAMTGRTKTSNVYNKKCEHCWIQYLIILQIYENYKNNHKKSTCCFIQLHILKILEILLIQLHNDI